MLIKTEEEFYRSLETFTETLVVDTETTGLDLWNVDRLCGVGVCTTDEKTYYYPFRHVQEKFLLASLFDGGELNLPESLLAPLMRALESRKTLIGHNIKFDLSALHKDGFVKPRETVLEDTMSAARLYFREKFDRLSLENTSKAVLKDSTDLQWKAKFGDYMKAHKLPSYAHAEPTIIAEYCEADCLATWRVRNELVKYIETTEQTRVWDQEVRLISTLWDMEREGLYFDREYRDWALPKLEEKLLVMSAEIYELAGKQFDIGSNPQLTVALSGIGITSSAFSESGGSKWGEEVLLTIEHPIAGLIMEWRGIDKMRSTYFEPLDKWSDNRQHPSFRSAGPITGRMACHSPNLQNLSNKSISLGKDQGYDEEVVAALKARLGAKGHASGEANQGSSMQAARFSNIIATTSKFEDSLDQVAIKRLYVPPEKYRLVLIDYNQMEMRVFSDYVRDPVLDKMLNSDDFDFHGFVAEQVWKVDATNSLWKFYRTLAKQINFGMIYGIGISKLARQIQKPIEEAKQYKTDYFKRFPKAKDFMRNVQRAVQSRGWVKNRFGRRYYVPLDRDYVAVNYLIQGTSADVVKNRMNACHEFLLDEKLQSKLVVQVHDELVFYIHEDEIEIVRNLKEIIERRVLETYLPADVAMGFPSWAQKKDLCLKCFQAYSKDKELKGEITHQCTS